VSSYLEAVDSANHGERPSRKKWVPKDKVRSVRITAWRKKKARERAALRQWLAGGGTQLELPVGPWSGTSEPSA